VVEPKRRKLAEAEAQLRAANAQLRDKQASLATVAARVNAVRQQLATAEAEQRQLGQQVRRRSSTRAHDGSQLQGAAHGAAGHATATSCARSSTTCSDGHLTRPRSSAMCPLTMAMRVCGRTQAEVTRKRLERAGKLTSGLSEEAVRWQATADELQAQMGALVGDVLLSAAVLCYCGAFTGAYRCALAGCVHGSDARVSRWRQRQPAHKIVGLQHHSWHATAVRVCHTPHRVQLVRGWVSKCQEAGVPLSDCVSLRGTLSSAVEVREWRLAALPGDSTSVDNAVLATRCKRWPLMIDPQVCVCVCVCVCVRACGGRARAPAVGRGLGGIASPPRCVPRVAGLAHYRARQARGSRRWRDATASRWRGPATRACSGPWRPACAQV
jgi:hypothetical protein